MLIGTKTLKENLPEDLRNQHYEEPRLEKKNKGSERVLYSRPDLTERDSWHFGLMAGTNSACAEQPITGDFPSVIVERFHLASEAWREMWVSCPPVTHTRFLPASSAAAPSLIPFSLSCPTRFGFCLHSPVNPRVLAGEGIVSRQESGLWRQVMGRSGCGRSGSLLLPDQAGPGVSRRTASIL